ncbi:methylisocitrate lyase [Cladophialophora psammophila CBS 110553]|uniref:Methylisocitrate lyase n=1 Tax=Cladophialophora psammophila CBS 110553 TaxID=1182543 RepID=W9XCI1_9EURO|nr:methylisocitrate lyase [Cladophialophora psammophila CBS 110553]EXJ75020.1 methylisocitrate lyase [Cladophialophora psammophila CBS 110553]
MAQTNGHDRPQPPSTGAARLRELMAGGKIVVCPGVYDGFSARIMIEAGVDAMYMTGAGTSISRLGMADLGLATMNEMATNAAMIAGLDPVVPLIADADTGYGGPLSVRRTVQEYIKAGVAGLHLEDQVQTKRCGHLGSKELVDEEVYISRIRAAVLARAAIPNGDIVIIARTDALQGLGYDAAVSRLKKALAAGADVAFLEAPTKIEQMRAVCQDLAPAPVLLNMVTGSITPNISVDEAQEVGYRIIIYPALALGPAYEAISAAANELKGTGTVKLGKVMVGGPKKLFETCGLNELIAFDLASGGSAYKNGV